MEGTGLSFEAEDPEDRLSGIEPLDKGSDHASAFTKLAQGSAKTSSDIQRSHGHKIYTFDSRGRSVMQYYRDSRSHSVPGNEDRFQQVARGYHSVPAIERTPPHERRQGRSVSSGVRVQLFKDDDSLYDDDQELEDTSSPLLQNNDNSNRLNPSLQNITTEELPSSMLVDLTHEILNTNQDSDVTESDGEIVAANTANTEIQQSNLHLQVEHSTSVDSNDQPSEQVYEGAENAGAAKVADDSQTEGEFETVDDVISEESSDADNDVDLHQDSESSLQLAASVPESDQRGVGRLNAADYQVRRFGDEQLQLQGSDVENGRVTDESDSENAEADQFKLEPEADQSENFASMQVEGERLPISHSRSVIAARDHGDRVESGNDVLHIAFNQANTDMPVRDVGFHSNIGAGNLVPDFSGDENTENDHQISRTAGFLDGQSLPGMMATKLLMSPRSEKEYRQASQQEVSHSRYTESADSLSWPMNNVSDVSRSPHQMTDQQQAEESPHHLTRGIAFSPSSLSEPRRLTPSPGGQGFLGASSSSQSNANIKNVSAGSEDSVKCTREKSSAQASRIQKPRSLKTDRTGKSVMTKETKSDDKKGAKARTRAKSGVPAMGAVVRGMQKKTIPKTSTGSDKQQKIKRDKELQTYPPTKSGKKNLPATGIASSQLPREEHPSIERHLSEHGVNLSPIRPVVPTRGSPGKKSPNQQRQKLDMCSDGNKSVKKNVEDLGANISNMEQIRQNLQAMLSMSNEAISDKAAYNQADDVENLLTIAHSSGEPSDIFSESLASVGLPGAISSNFDSILSYSSKYFTSGEQSTKPDAPSLLAENHTLREILEKERYRRKHCEQQINQLQNKLLEVQQQLAVAVSTDRKKDLMIGQLDKTLLQVVQGWKKNEGDAKTEFQKLQQENSAMKRNQILQQETLVQLERELAIAAEELPKAHKRVEEVEQQQKEQAEIREAEWNRVQQMINLEQERMSALELQLSRTTELKDKMQKQLSHITQTYEREKKCWEEKDKNYTDTFEESVGRYSKLLEQEKNKFEQQYDNLQQVQKTLTSSQKETQQLQIDLDTAVRHRESMKVEIGLIEARYENSKRKLETDLHATMEKTIAEKLEGVQRRNAQSAETMQEKHRQQVEEILQRQTEELQKQTQHHHLDLQRQEERHQRQMQDYQTKMEEVQHDIEELSLYNKKIENQRTDITCKLQAMMQAHCNQALRLLHVGGNISQSTTPVKDGSFSLTYSQSPIRQVVGSSSVSNHGNVTTSVAPASSTVQRYPTFSTSPSSAFDRVVQKINPPTGEPIVVQTRRPTARDEIADRNIQGEDASGQKHNPLSSVAHSVTSEQKGPESLHVRKNNQVYTQNSQYAFYQNQTSDVDQNSFFAADQAVQHMAISPTQPANDGAQNSMEYTARGNILSDQLRGVRNGLQHVPDGATQGELAAASNAAINNRQLDAHGLQREVPGSDSESTAASGISVRTAHAIDHALATFVSVPHSDMLRGQSSQQPTAVVLQPPVQMDSSLAANSLSYHNVGSESQASFSPRSAQHYHRQQVPHHDHSGSTIEDDMTQAPERLDSLESSHIGQIADKFQEHETRQRELQHYIEMLLERQVKIPLNEQKMEPEQDRQRSPRITLYSPEKDQITTSPRGRGDLEKPLTIPTGDTLWNSQRPDAMSPEPSDVAQAPGVLSPQQVGEISRLLGLYRDETSGDNYSDDHNSQIGEGVSSSRDLNKRDRRVLNRSEHSKEETSKSPRSKQPGTSKSVAPVKAQAKVKSNLKATHVIHQRPHMEEKQAIQIPVGYDATKHSTKQTNIAAPKTSQIAPASKTTTGKKQERKVASSAKHQQTKPAPAWK